MELVAAHHAAVAEVVVLLEREVAATRAGVAARDGAVAQVGVAGIASTAYDHWDSRCGDPQLHTHVVISNKVKTLLDGKVAQPGQSSDARLSGRSLGALQRGAGRPTDRNPGSGGSSEPEVRTATLRGRSSASRIGS